MCQGWKKHFKWKLSMSWELSQLAHLPLPMPRKTFVHQKYKHILPNSFRASSQQLQNCCIIPQLTVGWRLPHWGPPEPQCGKYLQGRSLFCGRKCIQLLVKSSEIINLSSFLKERIFLCLIVAHFNFLPPGTRAKCFSAIILNIKSLKLFWDFLWFIDPLLSSKFCSALENFTQVLDLGGRVCVSHDSSGRNPGTALLEQRVCPDQDGHVKKNSQSWDEKKMPEITFSKQLLFIF